MAETFSYDVFISHSAKDKPAARELAERLCKDGLHVWLDDWEIKPGDPSLLKIQEGLEQARSLVLLMSKHASKSEWVTFEHHSWLFRDLSAESNQQRRFIPLRLDDADIPDALKQFVYVDWRQRSEEEYARLLAACRPVGAGTERVAERKDQAQPSKAFKGHTGGIRTVAVTPDSMIIISGSDDCTLRVWEMNSGKCLDTLEGHTYGVLSVAVTPDGKRAVSGSDDTTVRVWELRSGRCLTIYEGHITPVYAVAITPDGRRVITGSADGSVQIWEIDSGHLITTVKGHFHSVRGVTVTPDSRQFISGSMDNTVRVWRQDPRHSPAKLKGHSGSVWGVAMTPNGQHIISGSADGTVRMWELDSGRCLATLEGHTNSVYGVAATPDSCRVISGSEDKTVRVWEVASGRCIATLEGHTGSVFGVAVTPDGQHLVSGSLDKTVRVWEIPSNDNKSAESATTRYTNAKVLLVGDSGVGKSGLALRLTEDRFEPTISTDGAAVTRVTDEWATHLKLPHDASTPDTEREIWLWDFAGQSDYRLIHQLFMDETALAVLIFNPQAENPFEGLGQWDRDLQRAARRPFKKLLVAGRCDRGALMVSREGVERFRDDRGFANYLETSAQTGAGCNELRDAIIRNIPWTEIPWTASPHIFRLLKEEIVKLKDEGKVLLRMGELKQQLEMRLLQQSLQDGTATPGKQLPNKKSAGQNKSVLAIPENFKLEELRAVVGLLAGAGVVWQLEFGDFVLLQPERINGYAAAVMRQVRAHPDEIGSILEEGVLAGKLDYQDMQRLPSDEEQIILQAMHQTFVRRGLCLREPTESGPLLVFPSYFRRERPKQEDHPSALVTYNFSGMLDEIYATLVVRLHYTTAFEKDQLWRFAADFKTQAGQRVGLKMTRKPEGAGEITIYCAAGVAVETQVNFIRYVHDHLKTKDPEVKYTRHYVCGHCGTPVTNHETVRKKLAEGKKEIVCVDCMQWVPLWDLIEEKFASEETQATVRAMDEQARRAIDNESRELILLGHAFAIAGEAGQIFRPTPNSDWGIDGEIEFKNNKGEASGRRVYLQLKSGDSYLETRKDGREVFRIPKERHVEYWTAQEYPVMLVIRTSDGQIRWMNVTEYLKKRGKAVKQIDFDGEPFTAMSLWRMRDRLFQ